MNNNSNNPKGNQSDIITKKGFLISLPGKKKTESTSSSINLAKPQNEQKQTAAPKADGENRPNKNNNKNFHKNKKHNRNFDNKNNNNSNNNNSNNNNNNQQNQKNNNDVKKTEQNKTENNRDFAKRDKKNFHKNKKHNRNFDNKHKDFGENANNNQPLPQKTSAPNVVNQQKPKTEPVKREDTVDSFSVFSSFDHKKKAREAQEPDIFSSNLSLEEKYKDAKPLAEQIKEQELRQKGIKIPESTSEIEDEKQEIVGIRFREAGKIYYFDPEGVSVPFGTPVIVETARGSEYGITAISNRFVPTSSLVSPLKKIERLATQMDTQKHIANKQLEADAEKVFLEKVQKLGLPMKLIYVEYTFDNTRLLFYFTAETRIDFRELVKELAGVFRTRIELRQIGVRDEAKVIGGLGVCGRASCCNTFLGDFAQVSIKMAKDQSLSLNAAKISGACGKLMCCLRYEDKVYEEENQRTPRVGSIVETPEGRGHVVERNALKGIVNVVLDISPEVPAKPFFRDQVTVIGFNKDKGEKDDELDNLDEIKDIE